MWDAEWLGHDSQEGREGPCACQGSPVQGILEWVPESPLNGQQLLGQG